MHATWGLSLSQADGRKGMMHHSYLCQFGIGGGLHVEQLLRQVKLLACALMGRQLCLWLSRIITKPQIKQLKPWHANRRFLRSLAMFTTL
jgi:hypothetical protein